MFRLIKFVVLFLPVMGFIAQQNALAVAFIYPPQQEVVRVKAREAFEIDNLSIVITEVTYATPITGLRLGQSSYFDASMVFLKITNTHAGKIKNWKGLYHKAELEDEFGNVFGVKNIFGWTFPGSKVPPDTEDVGIDPKETIYVALYFREVPKTSKKFTLTLPIEGKKVICVGEVNKIEKDIEERMKNEKEKEKKERMLAEQKRKEMLEDRGEAFYPIPATVYQGRNAEQWYVLVRKGEDVSDGLAALAALKEEGIPFLIELLKNEQSPQGRQQLLSHISPNLIHPNDIPKFIDHLDKNKNQIATRVLVLDILARSGRANKYKEKIQFLTKDLLANPKVNGFVKNSMAAINKNN